MGGFADELPESLQGQFGLPGGEGRENRLSLLTEGLFSQQADEKNVCF